MPKKRPADDRGGGRRAAKVSKTRRRRRHLYLVLDDWERGYSIRKLDLSSPDSDSDVVGSSSTTQQRLPPAVFRVEAPHALSALFTTFGTKIVATHQTPRRAALMWDVSTRALTFGPRHKYEPNSLCNAYVEVSGQLFLVDDASFEVLDPPPPPPPLDDGVEIVWKWQRLPPPPPPFGHAVVAHAVHPDGRTVFLSSEEKTRKRTKVATFSFDAESGEWTCHGEWRLPFNNRGYFDPEMEAWVGLSADADTLGHICAFELVPGEAVVDQASPSMLSKEKLFCVDPAEKHIGATLVYMGSRSRYCLVQCLSVSDRQEDIWEEFLPERIQYLLRVTTFFLKYDRNDLHAVAHGQVRSYRLPKSAAHYYDHLEKPVAFWM